VLDFDQRRFLRLAVALLFNQEASMAATDFGLNGFPRSFMKPRAANSADIARRLSFPPLGFFRASAFASLTRSGRASTSRRLAHVENIPQQDSASNAFNKLARTFAAQMAALKDYRSKGEQKMTVVHVAEGGQAIVGNVNAPAEGVGARKKSEGQPHAQLAYAPGVEMPRQIEAEREALPIAGGAGA
jgi:hypothetical protein